MIVHIVESTATGTLSMVRLVANSQVEAGHMVSVVYSRRDETPSEIESYFDDRVGLVNVQMSSLSDRLKAFLKIRNIVNESSVEVVFLHSSFAGFLGRLALLFKRVKVFYIPHCISFMRKDISRIKFILFVFLEWIASVKKTTYLACSTSEAKAIQKNIPFSKCVVVENAVDVNEWAVGDVSDISSVVIITVGQIRLQKDPLRFSEIASRVCEIHNNVEFVWVGDGDPVYKKYLLDSGVKITGWKEREEVKKLLENSQYYLSTSLWEGMPVSPIESMLAGCVPILSDCAGNVDIVSHGETGFIYDSIEDCVNIISRLLTGLPLTNKVSLASRESCLIRFSKERYVDDMNKIIMME